MKVLGHPVHLMLIHFPSALFPMDVICVVLGFYTGDLTFYNASFYAMLGGTVLGWLAVITGLMDVGTLTKTKSSLIKKALIHGGVNTIVLIVYSLFTIIALEKYPEFIKDDPIKLCIKSLTVIILIVGNYIGGSLVLKDKVLD